MDTTTDMDFSTDGGKTWNPCTKPLDVSGLTGQTIIIRNHGDRDFFPSSGVTVTIPVRREAPKVEVDSRAQTVSSDKGVEWSADNGKTWTALSKPLNTADHLGQTMLEGKIPFHYDKTLGYRKGPDGKPEIDPEEAETVRLIYRLYLDGWSLGDIQKELTEKKIPTARGIQGWSRQVIQNILLNEKYIGDGLRQKTFTTGSIGNKKVMKNQGDVFSVCFCARHK